MKLAKSGITKDWKEIIEELRSHQQDPNLKTWARCIMMEAADEIERLRDVLFTIAHTTDDVAAERMAEHALDGK